MTPFEDKLRQALRPVAAPPGFVERTLTRAGRAAQPKRVLRFPRLLAALAASLLLVIGGQQYAGYRRGQLAKEQLMLALEITGSQLNLVHQKVTAIGSER